MTEQNTQPKIPNTNKFILFAIMAILPHIEPIVNVTQQTWKSVTVSSITSLLVTLVAYLQNPEQPIPYISPFKK